MSFHGAGDVDPVLVIDEINSDPRKVVWMRRMLNKLSEVDHWALSNGLDPWMVRQVWLLHQEVITQAALRSSGVSASTLDEFDREVIELSRGKRRKRFPIQRNRIAGVRCPKCRFVVDALGNCVCSPFEDLR